MSDLQQRFFNVSIFFPHSPAVSLVAKPYVIKPFGDVYLQ